MIVFFVRGYNDIDHMVPVIYKFAKEKTHSFMVLCLAHGYNIWQNPGITFLRDKLNVKVDYVYNLYTPSLMHRVLSFLMCGPYHLTSWRSRLKVLIEKANFKNFIDFILQIFISLLWRLFSQSIDKLRTTYFNSTWAEGLFRRIDAEILIFDWVKYYQYITAAFLSAAGKLEIPTIALPNGVRTWACESFKKEDLSSLGETYLFDYIVSSNQNCRKTFIKGGILAEKIYVLGSARFCPEWIKKYPEVYPSQKFASKNRERKLLKVVYMEGGRTSVRNKEELISTIRKIYSLDFIDFVVKPKTRGDKLQIAELGFVPQIVEDVSSHDLCKWADVIIMAPSSIYLEVLWQDKVFIYPKFLFMREMVFESRNVGWIVNSYEELEAALRKLKDKPDYKPYSNDTVERFLIETVSDGVKNRDVLGGYRDFILKVRRDVKEKRITPKS